ncbi:uncharacterized protein LOC142467231 [Ascaphus truei]|uniref:uncharacterized protein LOC142467231 n=1 Tax=Ascaphus truei TaxID=8439 RepID=UPI003F5AABB4
MTKNPVVISQITSNSSLPGSDVSLHVLFSGEETTVTWEVDGGALPARYQLSNGNRTLLIPSAQRGDDGRRFSVGVTNPVSEDSREYVLQLIGAELIVHQESINVTAGQSVLLATSYTITHPNSRWLTIEWTISSHSIVYHSSHKGFTNAQHFPTRSSEKTSISPIHQGRVEFYPENASLLLKNLQLNDSGTYVVTLQDNKYIIKKNISVWVHENTTSPGAELIVHQESINVTAGQSILLATSYTITHPNSHWLTIEWTISNRSIVYHSSHKGFTNAQHFPTRSSGKTSISSTHQGRVQFYPENASLLLTNFQLNDSGIYVVTLQDNKYIIKKNISVWVHENTTSPGT